MMDMILGELSDLPESTTVDAGKSASRPNRRRSERLKLVVEISPDLHQRIIEICATRRVPVNQAVRNVLEHAFPR